MVEVLVTKFAVEALAKPVLPRRTGFDVKHVDTKCAKPFLDRRRDELWPVVATNPLRNAVHRKQTCQRVDRIFTGDAAADLDAQADTRVLIDNVQESNRSSLDSGGMNEVPCPHVVDEACRRNLESILAAGRRSDFARSALDGIVANATAKVSHPEPQSYVHERG